MLHDLPGDVLALVFVQNGLDTLVGLKDRCSCNLVCRAWHEVLSRPQFQRAGRINVGRFDSPRRLGHHLHRFQERHLQLQELEWHGHLHTADSYRKEEHLLQPVLIASWRQLRVLRLVDCSVATAALAAVGAACPALEELRFRGASASYSPEHVSARSELVRLADILQIAHGCPRLRVLDVACHGSTPFALHFRPALAASIAELLPQLEELTIFGRFEWASMTPLAALKHLQLLRFFGLQPRGIAVPFALPQLSTSCEELVLEEYAMDSKLVVTLANALPQLASISVLLMPTAAVLSRLPLPDNGNLGVDVVQFQEKMDMELYRDLETLAAYFQQPFGKRVTLAVQWLDSQTVYRQLPA